MKILFTMFGWNEFGGGTTFPKTLAKSLLKKGYEVGVFFAAGKHHLLDMPYYLEDKIDEGINLFGVYNRPTTFLDEANPKREVYDERIIQLFKFAVSKFQPDLIHFHNFLGLSFGIADVAKSFNIPTLFTPHNYHLIDPKLYLIYLQDNVPIKWNNVDLLSNSPLIKLYPEKIIDYKIRQAKAKELITDKLDYLLCISTNQAKIFNDFSENKANNIIILNQISEVCQNIHQKEHKYEINEPLKIGYLGSLSILKGINILFQTAELLKNQPIEFHLFGNDTSNYFTQISNAFPEAKAIYRGKYKPDELAQIAKTVHLTFLPIISNEGGPLVAVESLALGLPVVASYIGGIPDYIINDFNGFLINSPDPIEFYKLFLEILHNPEKLNSIYKNTFLPINYNDYLNQLISIYNFALEGRKDKINSFNFIIKNFYNSSENNKSEENSDVLITDEIQNTTFTLDELTELVNMNKNQEETGTKTNLNQSKSKIPIPLLLHLGSQQLILEGFHNLDAQPKSINEIKADVSNLPYNNESADLIYAINLLQVFNHRKTKKVLDEWARVLKKGGLLILTIPNMKHILKLYQDNQISWETTNLFLFGKQQDNYDYYYNGFDKDSIIDHLTKSGFQILEIQELIEETLNNMPIIYLRSAKN